MFKKNIYIYICICLIFVILGKNFSELQGIFLNEQVLSDEFQLTPANSSGATESRNPEESFSLSAAITMSIGKGCMS